VVVLGAGPAGLAAAHRLACRGLRVVVVERTRRVGGMAASIEVAGVRVDFGSHLLHRATAPGLLRLLHELLGDDLQVRERRGRIRLDDRWVPYPLRAGTLVRSAPPRFVAGAAVDVLAAPFRRPRADTFAEVVRARLGPTVSRGFYEPFVAKIWGEDPDRLSGELARRRVSLRSPLDVARRVRRGARSEGRTFFYPRRGFGQLSEALADAIVARGGEVRLGSEVRAVRVGSGGAGVVLADGTGIDAARVWSTVPLPALARLADPPPPPEVLGAAGRLTHRGLALVYLVLDRPSYQPVMTHYFPAAGVVLSRLSEPRHYRDGRGVDPPDRTVLCAEVPCTPGDDVWAAGDDDLGARVADALVREGLPDPAPVAVEVHRLARVYPVYRVGFERDLAALEAWAGGLDRLLTFGRSGLFAPDNTHHALVMGEAAAASLRGDGSFDVAAWRRARDGFRSHVVED
jgi:protoporphyrinogen oxidase